MQRYVLKGRLLSIFNTSCVALGINSSMYTGSMFTLDTRFLNT